MTVTRGETELVTNDAKMLRAIHIKNFDFRMILGYLEDKIDEEPDQA